MALASPPPHCDFCRLRSPTPALLPATIRSWEQNSWPTPGQRRVAQSQFQRVRYLLPASSSPTGRWSQGKVSHPIPSSTLQTHKMEIAQRMGRERGPDEPTSSLYLASWWRVSCWVGVSPERKLQRGISSSPNFSATGLTQGLGLNYLLRVSVPGDLRTWFFLRLPKSS